MNLTEHARTILGVEGRAFARHVWPAHPKVPERARGLWSSQTWKASREWRAGGQTGRITAELRFDDNCRNGHHSFAITGTAKAGRDHEIGGCIHEEIARYFPELAPLIKWHLFDQTGPMHYVANTLYFAGNRDCRGRAPGEPSAWETFVYFGDSPIGHKVDAKLAAFIRERLKPLFPGSDTYSLAGDCLPFEVRAHDHPRDVKTFGTHYTLATEGSAGEFSKRQEPDWYGCPFTSEVEAQQFALALNTCRVNILTNVTKRSEGKARELDNARSAASWPEATDAELMQEPEALKAVLLARLPQLLVEFRAAMESCGFAWEAPGS